MNQKKDKTIYVCQQCGYNSSKYLGRCSSCLEWNTFVEEMDIKPSEKMKGISKNTVKMKRLKEIVYTEENRIILKDMELNRVLGGGIVNGAVILVGGEPGIGKSTLMLQLAISLESLKVVYISGEESETQIKMRAERISPNSDCYLLTETNIQDIISQAEGLEPQIIIIDSIQTLFTTHLDSIAGSISQIRTCAAQLVSFAKKSNIAIFIIGHITKDGNLAGPKVLEHIVDTVLQFEGDRHLSYRILRAIKNRFGSTSELGIYEMSGQGMREVSNPSEILISPKRGDVTGVSIGVALEGNRPLLIEVQSLVTPATYSTPQRACTGYDNKRLNMLLAVLEKQVGVPLGNRDIFLNITGGLRIEDPAIDLAVSISIISSFFDVSINYKTCFAGEVGLSGEIRAINRLENRIVEAYKLGFKKIYISDFNTKNIDLKNKNINISAFSELTQVVQDLAMGRK